ncbi:MAG: hypothetical protein M0Z71_00865 [Nitrospiraceae bacterium]|nr:hypothetical protein [Nitrospiraceae bacterium]
MPEELKAAKAKVWAEQQQFWQQVDRDAQTRFAGMPDGPEKEAAIEAHNTEAMDMFNRAIKPKLWAEYTRKEKEVVKRMGLQKAPDSWLGEGI